jgi:hypothetical protein
MQKEKLMSPTVLALTTIALTISSPLFAQTESATIPLRYLTPSQVMRLMDESSNQSQFSDIEKITLDYKNQTITVLGSKIALQNARNFLKDIDVKPTEFLIKVEFLQDNKVISMPILKTMGSTPATISMKTSEKNHQDVKLVLSLNKDNTVNMSVKFDEMQKGVSQTTDGSWKNIKSGVPQNLKASKYDLRITPMILTEDASK